MTRLLGLLLSVGFSAMLFGCEPLPSEDLKCDVSPNPASPANVIDVYVGEPITLRNEVVRLPGSDLRGCSIQLDESIDTSKAGVQMTHVVSIGVDGEYEAHEVIINVLPRPVQTTVPLHPMIDLFTGANCYYCPDAEHVLNDAKALLPTAFDVLAWHMDVPTADEWAINNWTDGARDDEWNRFGDYTHSPSAFTPFTVVAGAAPTAPASFTAQDFALAVEAYAAENPTPVQLDVDGRINTGLAKVNVKVVARNLGLAPMITLVHVAIFQNNIINKPIYYTYTAGITDFDHVAREYQVRSTSLEVNYRHVYNFEFDLDSRWYTGVQTVGAVAWIQNLTPGTVSAYSSGEVGTTLYGTTTVHQYPVYQSQFIELY